MANHPPTRGTGACRLFGKFLVILVPIFLAASAVGLSFITEYLAQSTHDQVSARIGNQVAHIAASLARRDQAVNSSASQDLLSTLLHDTAILCAEVRPHSANRPALKAPQGLGCVGQEEAEQFSILIGQDGARSLHVHFTMSEVEATRQSHREFSILAMLIGLCVAIGASFLGFRLIVGKPLKALLFAITQSDERGELVHVPVSGNDELSTVIRAYNRMQRNLAEEADRVREKSAELSAERHRNEAMLSKVFHVSPYPFALLSPDDGRYFNVNEAWLSTMGYSRSEVIGKSANDLGIWADPAERARFIDLCSTKKAARDFETIVRTKDGRKLDVRISGEHVQIGDDTRLFMVADDVTELKKAEAERKRHHEDILDAYADLEDTNDQLFHRTKELEAAQETLVKQERLATLGELTATVSHEIKNPLGAIRSSLHLAIQKTKGLDLGVARSLERAERNVVRCDKIIGDLLGYASEPMCKADQITGDEWLRVTLSELEVPADVELVKSFDAPDAQLTVAPERIRRVVVNIFENAVQALADMPEGKPRLLTVSTAVKTGNYVIVLEDNGPGMDPELLSKAFEPLFSTKSYGCGLGLSTAKKIIERYGGTIRFDSEVGVGTTVTMTLPETRVQERAA